MATAQTLPPFEENGHRFTPTVQLDDLALQLGYVLPRAPTLVQDLRNVARAALPSWRARQLDLRDLLSADTHGGGWVRMHGAFGQRDFGVGDLSVGLEDGAVSVGDAIADFDDVLRADPSLLPAPLQSDLDAAVAGITNLDHDTNVYGFNVGFDLIHGSAETARWLVGGTVGYLRSRTEFDDLQAYGLGSQFDGDTVNVGVYGSLVSGGYYIDAAVSQAWHSVDLDLPALELRPAGSMLGTDGSSLSGQIDMGWRPVVGEGSFYVEPVAGLVWVRTDIDDINIYPADALVLGSQGSRLKLGSEESLRGSIGVRVGTTPWTLGGLRLKGELGWRTWREFKGETTATLALRGQWLDLNDPDAVSVAGFYSLPPVDARFDKGLTEMSVGAGLQNADGRLSGFMTLTRYDGGAYESDALTAGFRFQW